MGRASFPSGDLISGAVLAALGVFILSEARKWTYSASDGPGPGFFPVWYGIALIVLSLAMMVQSLRRTRTSETGPLDRAGLARALSTWAAFAVAAALLKPLGFLVSFALLTFFIVSVVFRRPLTTAAATAIGAALAFYLVFPLALNVPLPTGILGF